MFISVINEIFEILENEEINWMLIRNLDFEKSITNKGDVDVVVHENTNYIKLKELLVEKGFFLIEPIKGEFKDLFINIQKVF